MLIQTLIQVAFAARTWPEDVPLVRVCKIERICLQEWPDQLGVPLEQLVEHLGVVDVVATLRLHRRRRVVEQLGAIYWRNGNDLVEGLDGGRIQILTHVVGPIFYVPTRLVKEVLLCSWLAIICGWNEEWKVVLDIPERIKCFYKSFIACHFVDGLLRHRKVSLLVAHGARARLIRVLSINSDPLTFKLRLNHFQTI